MKNLLLAGLLLLLAALARPAAAQDLLTRLDGTEVSVKVVEITPDLIKYKRADNPDGPLISVRKTDVFRIRYANGSQEVITAPAGGVPPPTPVGATSPGSGNRASPAPASGPPASGAPAIYIPVTQPTLATAVPGDEIRDDETVHLSGPRIGFTLLTDGPLSRAREHEFTKDLSPFLMQFGWQFETRLFRLPNGVSGLAEIIPLVGGLEQGKFIPSISGMLGIRGPKGLEFGMGPNLTPLGPALVLAAGASFHSGGINFPVNLAVVPGEGGARFSLLVGFNTRRN